MKLFEVNSIFMNELREEILKLLEHNVSSGIKKIEDSYPLLSQSKKRMENSCSPICHEGTQSKGLVFSCFDCAKSDGVVLCHSCFFNGDHYNHRTTPFISNLWFCDCGNVECFPRESFCSIHRNYCPNKDIDRDFLLIRDDLRQYIRFCLINLNFYSLNDGKTAIIVFKWFISKSKELPQFFDLLCEEIISSYSFYENFQQLGEFRKDIFDDFLKFRCVIANNHKIQFAYSQALFKFLPSFFSNYLSVLSSDQISTQLTPIYQYMRLFRELFIAFNEGSIMNLVNGGYDIAHSISLSIDTIFARLTNKFRWSLQFYSVVNSLMSLLNSVIKVISRMQKHDYIQIIRDEFIRLLKYTETMGILEQTILPNSFKQVDFQSELFELTSVLNMSPPMPIYESKEMFILIKNKIISNKGDNSNIPFKRIDPNALSIFLDFHFFAFSRITSGSIDPITIIKTEFNEDVEEFLSIWCVYPVRLLAKVLSVSISEEDSNGCFAYINSKTTTNKLLLKCFKILKLSLILTEDKPRMINLICNIFTASPSKISNPTTRFSFLHVLCILLFNNNILMDDEEKEYRTSLQTQLLYQPQPSHSFRKGSMKDDALVAKVFRSLVKLVNRNNEEIIELIDQNSWNPLLPWIDFVSVLKASQRYIDNNPKTLVPFPVFQGSYCLCGSVYEMSSIFSQPLIHYIIYSVLHDFVFNSFEYKFISIHYICHIILLIHSLFPGEIIETNSKSVTADDHYELFEICKEPFHTFITTKIVFLSQLSQSVLSMMNFSDVGKDVYDKLTSSLNVVTHPQILNQEKTIDSNFPKIPEYLMVDAYYYRDLLLSGPEFFDMQPILRLKMTDVDLSKPHCIESVSRIKLPRINTIIGKKYLPNSLIDEISINILANDLDAEKLFLSFFVELTLLERVLRTNDINKVPKRMITNAVYILRLLWNIVKSHNSITLGTSNTLHQYLASVLFGFTPIEKLKNTLIQNFPNSNDYISIRQLRLFELMISLCDNSEISLWDQELSPNSLSKQYNMVIHDYSFADESFLSSFPKGFAYLFKDIDPKIVDFNSDISLCIISNTIISSSNIPNSVSFDQFFAEKEYSLFINLINEPTTLYLMTKGVKIKFPSFYVNQYGITVNKFQSDYSLELSHEKLDSLRMLILSGEWIENAHF